jgi:Icc protein
MLPLNRRKWMGTAAAAGLSLTTASAHSRPLHHDPCIRFGVITDVHQDIMHDGEKRMAAFAAAMKQTPVDFVIQLGDFCIPKPENERFRDLFHQIGIPCQHVLGNHDMDGGFRPDETVEFYGMPSRYYSFDFGGMHLVVLDGNEPGGQQPGYKRFISDTQLRWLKQDLADSQRPTIVFSHQPLNHASGVENGESVRQLLQQAHTDRSGTRIAGCFSGHFHLNHLEAIDNIHYAQINSAAYLWVGSEFAHHSYPGEVHQKHRYIQYTCPYEKPLWAIVEVDLEKQRVGLQGQRTQWVGNSPTSLKMPAPKWSDAEVRAPVISDRSWKY